MTEVKYAPLLNVDVQNYIYSLECVIFRTPILLAPIGSRYWQELTKNLLFKIDHEKQTLWFFTKFTRFLCGLLASRICTMFEWANILICNETSGFSTDFHLHVHKNTTFFEAGMFYAILVICWLFVIIVKRKKTFWFLPAPSFCHVQPQRWSSDYSTVQISHLKKHLGSLFAKSASTSLLNSYFIHVLDLFKFSSMKFPSDQCNT